jgi:hypothetical protein
MDKLRTRYVSAYQAANGGTPEIEYVNGWFRIRSARGSFFSNHREAEVRDFCRVLESRSAGAKADLGFVDRSEGGHGRESIKKSHRAEGRNFVD